MAGSLLMTDPIAELPEIRRRTRRALISSVLPAGMGTSASFAATSLVAEDITGSDTLATFAASMISIGGAITAVPLGRYMAEHGRRPGLLRAWVIGALGAFFAFLAVVTEVYPLLLIGVLGIGTGQAANLAARYAAADLAEETNRAREIGIVVWAGSIGSVLGPTVALGGTGWIAADLLGLDESPDPSSWRSSSSRPPASWSIDNFGPTRYCAPSNSTLPGPSSANGRRLPSRSANS